MIAIKIAMICIEIRMITINRIMIVTITESAVTRVSQLYTNAKGQAVQADIDQTYDEYGNVSSVTCLPTTMDSV